MKKNKTKKKHRFDAMDERHEKFQYPFNIHNSHLVCMQCAVWNYTATSTATHIQYLTNKTFNELVPDLTESLQCKAAA